MNTRSASVTTAGNGSSPSPASTASTSCPGETASPEQSGYVIEARRQCPDQRLAHEPRSNIGVLFHRSWRQLCGAHRPAAATSASSASPCFASCSACRPRWTSTDCTAGAGPRGARPTRPPRQRRSRGTRPRPARAAGIVEPRDAHVEAEGRDSAATRRHPHSASGSSGQRRRRRKRCRFNTTGART